MPNTNSLYFLLPTYFVCRKYQPEVQAMDTSLKNMLMITMTLVIQQSLIVTAKSPVVTLSHGGQLRGFTAAFGTAEVDAFIGTLKLNTSNWISPIKKCIHFAVPASSGCSNCAHGKNLCQSSGTIWYSFKNTFHTHTKQYWLECSFSVFWCRPYWRTCITVYDHCICCKNLHYSYK